MLYDMVRDPEGYSPSTADEKVVADAFESKLFSYLTTNIKYSCARGILLPYTRSLYAQYGKALKFLVEFHCYVLKSPHYQWSLLVKLQAIQNLKLKPYMGNPMEFLLLYNKRVTDLENEQGCMLGDNDKLVPLLIQLTAKDLL